MGRAIRGWSPRSLLVFLNFQKSPRGSLRDLVCGLQSSQESKTSPQFHKQDKVNNAIWGLDLSLNFYAPAPQSVYTKRRKIKMVDAKQSNTYQLFRTFGNMTCLNELKYTKKLNKNRLHTTL